MYITEGERIRCNARLYLKTHYGNSEVFFYDADEQAFIILINLSKAELEMQENTWTKVFETPDLMMYKKGLRPIATKGEQNVSRNSRTNGVSEK